MEDDGRGVGKGLPTFFSLLLTVAHPLDTNFFASPSAHKNIDYVSYMGRSPMALIGVEHATQTIQRYSCE